MRAARSFLGPPDPSAPRTVAQRFGLPLAALGDLDVDEVAGVLVGYYRQQLANGSKPHAGNTLNAVRTEAHEQGLNDDEYRAVAVRVSEAIQWLRNHVFLVDDPESSGWSTLTPAADQLLIPDYLIDLKASDLLGGLNLDKALEDVVVRQFRRGSYGLAALAAMRLVEDRVRRVANLDRRDVGKDLMHKAFKPGGPLADDALLEAENLGRAALFAGAMGAIKNEHSHHDVKISDPQEALELVLFANLLLRIIDRAAAGRRHDAGRRT